MIFDSDAEEQGASNGAIHYCSILNFEGEITCQSQKWVIFTRFYCRPRPNDIILFNCCMLYCRGCGPVAAVGRQRPPWSINETIPIVEESSPPCSFPAFFVATAATHHAYTASLPGRRGSTINLAWRRSSETSDPDDYDAPPVITRDYRQSLVQILGIPT